MNNFWGQHTNVQRLSRDENQVIALNYENLCDAEYLNRLFTAQSGEEDNNQLGHRLTKGLILCIKTYSSCLYLAILVATFVTIMSALLAKFVTS